MTVSIPDELFERAERLARREKCSRSDLYAQALRAYVVRNEPNPTTEAMNRVVAVTGGSTDRFLSIAAQRTLGYARSPKKFTVTKRRS